MGFISFTASEKIANLISSLYFCPLAMMIKLLCLVSQYFCKKKNYTVFIMNGYSDIKYQILNISILFSTSYHLHCLACLEQTGSNQLLQKKNCSAHAV